MCLRDYGNTSLGKMLDLGRTCDKSLKFDILGQLAAMLLAL